MASTSSEVSPSDDEAKGFLEDKNKNKNNSSSNNNNSSSSSRERGLDLEKQEIGPSKNRSKSKSLEFVVWALINIFATIGIVSLIRNPIVCSMLIDTRFSRIKRSSRT